MEETEITLIEVIQKTCPVEWQECFERAGLELVEISSRLQAFERGAVAKTVPHRQDIFRCFYSLSPEKIKVIIMGQDPYPGISEDGGFQATGLSFSLKRCDKVTSSLRNVYKELVRTYEGTPTPFIPPTHGDLTSWIDQGVFLLNRSLTTELGKPNAHKGLWTRFINKVLNYLLEINPDLIILTWGKAPEIEDIVGERGNHLNAGHPSGLNTRNPFFGCGHFIKVNEILTKKGKGIIDWHLPLEGVASIPKPVLRKAKIGPVPVIPF
jgi:uracil-DNA glycosylase